MTVKSIGKGRMDSDFKNPNHIGQKIIFEILSVNQDTMKVLSDGEELILHRPTD